ncbi:LpxL/LpxP family acyltransferase [Bacillus sp. SN10]|uniref:LpxL/LpxP family acyltransferase n=1 Tax=Bacillus sp. SN10 TaxID=2056493 RepID=UPI000C323E03|nr:hypothetical protein [Bacillus sp. SN10]PKJ54483.1 hypothetical protein CWE34_17730 [Bacillus sp. SN10]
MGNIKNLSFEELSKNIKGLMNADKEELLSLCSKPEEWSVPNHYISFVHNDTVKINRYREFLAQRPFHWAWLLRLLKERGIDNSFLSIDSNVTEIIKEPCIFAIPHFGLHMLVPLILGELIPKRYILTTGNKDAIDVYSSINTILPNNKLEFLQIPDIWILKKLINGYKQGNYPAIYPELSSSNDKNLFTLNLFNEKVHVPMGIEHLSRLCHSKVIPVVMTYNTKYELHFGPALQYTNEGSILIPLFNWLENIVKRYPDQWFGWRLFDEMLFKS